MTGLNQYEGGELINVAARRTLLVDSDSESESNVYESYGGVRGPEKARGVSWGWNVGGARLGVDQGWGKVMSVGYRWSGVGKVIMWTGLERYWL